MCVLFFFCFKQKTAYDMRMSDWSSDVCSSDLDLEHRGMVGTISETAGIDRIAIASSHPRRERGPTARPPHHAGVPDQPVGIEGKLARLRLVGDEPAVRIDHRPIGRAHV